MCVAVLSAGAVLVLALLHDPAARRARGPIGVGRQASSGSRDMPATADAWRRHHARWKRPRAEFDREFARMMIEHHKGAIEMATQEQTAGVSADAKALAATIEKTQTAEVATLQKILDRL